MYWIRLVKKSFVLIPHMLVGGTMMALTSFVSGCEYNPSGPSSAESEERSGAISEFAFPLSGPQDSEIYLVSEGNFTGWILPSGELAAPETAAEGMFIDLRAGETVRALFPELMVAPGDKVSFIFDAYSFDQSPVTVTISRLCDAELGTDFARYEVRLTGGPLQYGFLHTFSGHSGCMYAEISSSSDTRIYLRYIRTERLIRGR
ncbi:hypothetical protein ACWCOP_13790 [Maricaulaceae bacterium MS644]